MDYTSAETLRLVITQVQKRGVIFVMSEVGDRVREEFERDGILAMVGVDHIFESVQDAIEAYKTRESGVND